jgi:ribonuclease E
VAPDLIDRVESYSGERDAFDEFRVTEQIEKALERKVWLPSGGSLVIDRTEAMTVVDVNTGKFVGSGGNLEETVTKNNVEAAEEIVRQLRLRDIGGIIVVDFIDMVLESNRDLVLRRLIECLSRDRTKHQVAEVTSLGLVQMTRKKLGLGLLETFSEACDVCAGRGVIVHHDPVIKNRQPPQTDRRRGRGVSAGGGGGVPRQPHLNAGTHSITDDAKNALAQIAASTIHAHGQDEKPQPTETIDAPPAAETAAALAPRKRRRRGRAPLLAEQKGAEQTGAEETGADIGIVPLLELPESAASTEPPSAEQTELLLDSVFDALPQPKAPGQGRSRSRRASTAVITGGELAPASGDNPES